MTFAISRESYDRYMGRYSNALAAGLMSFAGVMPGVKVLDVGCGSGALTEALASRLGAPNVAGADPSEQLLQGCVDRVPGVEVRQADAANLPWKDATFDAVVSQLVMNFLPDPGAGLAEMIRVTRPGGAISCCTWDYATGMPMLRTFWDAALEDDESAPDEARGMSLCTEDELVELWERNGLSKVSTGRIEVSVDYVDFDDYWIPFMLGVGPAGAYCASLEPARLQQVRSACFRRLGSPKGPFTLDAHANAVRGRTGA